MVVPGIRGLQAKQVFRDIQSYLSDIEVLLSDYSAILNEE